MHYDIILPDITLEHNTTSAPTTQKRHNPNSFVNLTSNGEPVAKSQRARAHVCRKSCKLNRRCVRVCAVNEVYCELGYFDDFGDFYKGESYIKNSLAV